MLAVDRLWVGRVGTDALAALGVAHAALMVLATLIMGMAVGTLAGVARSIGSGDRPTAALFLGQGLSISVGLGGVLALAAFVLPELVMDFMGVGATVDAPATLYLRISMWAQLFAAPLYVVTFALQGAGEARAALRVSSVAPLVNAALDPVFIFGLDMGMPGAAWATLLSQALGLAVGLRIVLVGGLPLRLDPATLRLHGATARAIVTVGVPGTLEHLVRNVASFSLVKIIAAFGAAVLSAYTSAMVLIMALVFPGLAMGQAAASLVGQNLGADRPRRAWRTAWTAVGLYFVFMVVLGALTAIFAEAIIGAFDGNPVVVAEGARLLRAISTCFPFIAVALVLSKAFGGAGNTLPPMVAATVAHVVFQIPAVYLLGEAYGPTGAYWGMAGAFMVHGTLSAALFIPRFMPKKNPPAG